MTTIVRPFLTTQGKILTSTRPNTAGGITILDVTEGELVKIEKIFVTNVTGGTPTYTIYHNFPVSLAYQKPMAANDTEVINLGAYLVKGDNLTATINTTAAVTITIFGTVTLRAR